MQRIVLVISNIYNFIKCAPLSQIQCSIEILQDFRLIQSLLTELIYHESDPKRIFEELQISLTEQEKALGPKKFKYLIQSISIVTLEYVVSKIRNKQIEKGVLCLTYFQRNTQRYLSSVINMLIALTFALAQHSKATHKTMKNYLLDSFHLLTQLEKTNKQDPTIKDLRLLHSLFAGIFHFQAQNLSKAKSIFHEMVSTLTTRIHQQKLKNKRIQMTTITYFVLATYFLSHNYKKMGDQDLANYNLTQSLQFAESYLPDSQALLMFYGQNIHAQQKVVKLSRIQNKIQRIKSLHFTGQPRVSHSKNRTQNQLPECKIRIKKKEIFPKQIVEAELNQIFTLEEPKNYTLKKRTIQALNSEAQNRQTRITYYQQQINVFQSKKTQIDCNYQLQKRQQKLDTTIQRKKALKVQIANQMWAVIQTLKPTHKLNTYIQGFKTAIAYESSNKFFKFICSNVGIMGHMALFRYVRRFKTKLLRHRIKTILICGLKHQLQFFTHKVNKTFHIKVYNIESGRGVDDEAQVSDWLYDKLHKQPIDYHFNIQEGKLIPLEMYLERLSLKTLCQVKLFIAKLRYKVLKKNGLISNQKFTINVSFSHEYNNLSYIIFVTSKALSDGNYSHQIERIDNVRYSNPDYNISLNRLIVSFIPRMTEYELDQMLTKSILAAKQKHLKMIIRIQKIFRARLSRQQLKRRQEGISISTTQIGQTLFTLYIKGVSKCFFIEHLKRKYKPVILKTFHSNSLAFVNKLREQLEVSDESQEQLKVIEKYFKVRNIYRKLTKRSKQLQLDNNFSTKFKISLCFARKSKIILYKEKKVEADAMFMLTVKDFQQYPRKYQFRVFNLESQSLYSFDIKMDIQNAEKCFLENNLEKIHQNVNITDHKQAKIIIEGKPKSVAKSKRPNSKSTIISNYSNFLSPENYVKELPKQRMITRLQSRESYGFSRNKRNSIHFKARHKSALKQKDILLIKKWMEDSKENFNVDEQESDVSN